MAWAAALRRAILSAQKVSCDAQLANIARIESSIYAAEERNNKHEKAAASSAIVKAEGIIYNYINEENVAVGSNERGSFIGAVISGGGGDDINSNESESLI